MSWTWVVLDPISIAALHLHGANTVWTLRTFGCVTLIFLNPHFPLYYLVTHLISLKKLLSNGSFLLQTPDEMGHLNSINGCGVRSCDSLWEKRTNVSRDFFLSVRAEEVSRSADLGKASLLGGSGLTTPCYIKALIVSVHSTEDPRLFQN